MFSYKKVIYVKGERRKIGERGGNGKRTPHPKFYTKARNWVVSEVFN